MGDTLHAIIQSFSPKTEHSIDYWHEAATIEFGKNYEAMRVLRDACGNNGWPRDRGCHDSHEYKYCGDSPGERFHCAVGTIELAVSVLKDEKERTWVHKRLEAALAFMTTAIANGETIRILFYIM